MPADFNEQIDSDNKLTQERIQNSNDNLAVLRVVYGVSFGLGFWQLGQGLPWPLDSLAVVPPILVAVMLTLLSIRFYWAIGNIRSYIGNKKGQDITKIGRLIMTFHVPILMLHSFSFYVLCRLYTHMYDEKAEFAFDASIAELFSMIYIMLLFLNALWVYWCHSPRNLGDFSKSDALRWAANNFIFAAISLALVLSSSLPPHVMYFLVFSLFALNSAVDFYTTGHIYLFDEYG